MILGDFNFHYDSTLNPRRYFQQLCTEFNLIQHVTVPTHIHGHTIDLFLTKTYSELITSPLIQSILLTDHFAITTKLNIPIKLQTIKLSTYRNFKNINIHLFEHDLKTAMTNINNNHDIQHINDQLTLILDKHDTTQQSRLTIHNTTPWFNSQLSLAKRRTRKLYSIYRKFPTTNNYNIYINSRCQYRQEMYKTKTKYYTENINTAKHNNRRLFKITNKLLGRSSPNPSLIFHTTFFVRNLPFSSLKKSK